MKEKFVIYGAGEDGECIYSFLGEDKILYFIDGNVQKQGKEFCGKTIYSLQEGMQPIKETEVWIIVASDKYEDEITETLRENGLFRYVTRKEIGFFFSKGSITVNDGRNLKEVHSCLEHIYRGDNSLFQDSKSDVEFYLVDSFEIKHYLPLYNRLIEVGIKARIVSEPSVINTAGSWFDYYNAIDELKSNSVSYSDIANPNASVVITTQYPDVLTHYNNATKILFPYGVFLMKKSAFTFFKGVADSFDCIFTHGDLQIKILRELGYQTDAVSISYPKYLGGSVDRDSVLKKFNINTNKPILAYLPTWDEYGSIIEAGKELDKLRDDFYVVVKPHHCTLHLSSKAKEREMLYKCCDKVLEKADLLEMASIADLALCDAKTGAVSEIVFLNSSIKMVLIYKNCSVEDFFVDYNVLFKGVTSIDDLADAISLTMKDDVYIESRKEWISEAFSQNIEEGIERGVSKIQECLDEK